MDVSMVKEAIETNRPFTIRTAGGDVYEVPHRDFIAFSARKTTLILTYGKNGEDELAYIPLLTVSSIEAEPGVGSPA